MVSTVVILACLPASLSSMTESVEVGRITAGVEGGEGKAAFPVNDDNVAIKRETVVSAGRWGLGCA